MLLGRCQNAFEPHDKQIIDQVCVNCGGAAAHVFLLEAAHAIGNGAFDFALCLHLVKEYSEYFPNVLASVVGRRTMRRPCR
jgi:hypothetical protein